VTSKGGHPPGLVLVPVVVMIWLAGHALFWVSRKLAIRGKYSADTKNRVGGKWPLALILLVIVFGALFIFGLFGIVWEVFIERNSLHELIVPLAFWMPSSICFFGILLRQYWSRILAGVGFIVVAFVLLKEMIESLFRGYQNSNIEWMIAIIIFILLILFGLYILYSSRIKAYYYK
jgi:hypothetical protein